MTKVNVYNKTGQVIKDIILNEKIFAIKQNEGLIHQVVTAQKANARIVLAHTKGKGEVRGGGRKPWKQKGTGRARHGSIRSPLWVGGGIIFGPKSDRNFSKGINKKMKKKALFMTLSDKVINNKFIVIDNLDIPNIKTKNIKNVLSKLPVERKVLFIISKQNEQIWKSIRNLDNLKLLLADSLNVVDILNANSIVIIEDALNIIESVYIK